MLGNHFRKRFLCIYRFSGIAFWSRPAKIAYLCRCLRIAFCSRPAKIAYLCRCWGIAFCSRPAKKSYLCRCLGIDFCRPAKKAYLCRCLGIVFWSMPAKGVCAGRISWRSECLLSWRTWCPGRLPHRRSFPVEIKHCRKLDTRSRLMVHMNENVINNDYINNYFPMKLNCSQISYIISPAIAKKWTYECLTEVHGNEVNFIE